MRPPPRHLRHLHQVPEPSAQDAQIRLLVADDDRRVRMLVRAQLAGTEINVLEAADGHHALMRVEHEAPDAALLDWRMPGGGLPLARTLINDHGLAGRVMLSSIVDPRDRLEARRAGVGRYLVKPPSATSCSPRSGPPSRTRAWPDFPDVAVHSHVA